MILTIVYILMNLEISIMDKYNDLLFKDADISVNGIKKQIQELFLNYNTNHKNIDDVKNTIINNFKILYPTILITDHEILNYRIPLYYLVKTREPILINFFKNKFNISVDGSKIDLIINNVVYPSTYFEDMSRGDIKNYCFKIVNETKQNIDAANVTSTEDKIDKSTDMIIVGKSKLTFCISNNTNLLIFGVNYIFDVFIYCEYKTIKIKFLSNEKPLIKSLVEQSIEYMKDSSKIISSSIINITEYIIELHKIMLEPDSKGLLCLMIFGVKRFGDWIQAKMSKDLYFGVKTVDYFMVTYLALSGAPIIINNSIYNWKPNHDKSLSNFRIYKNIHIPPNQYFNFYGVNVLLNRFFFEKYNKYKNKYIKLNKMINKL